MSAPWQQAVDAAAGGEVASSYLLSGDEFLIKQATAALVEVLVPEASRSLNLVQLDGAEADAERVAQELATMPMFGGRKVVVVHDSTLLAGKANARDQLERAAAQAAEGKVRGATHRVLAVIGRAGWGRGELLGASEAKWQRDLGVTLSELDPAFLRQVAAEAEEAGLEPGEGRGDALERIISRGLGQTTLIVSSPKIDKKNPLAKQLLKGGVHIELSAPQKGRGIDGLDVSAVVEQVLGDHGKRLEGRAEAALKRAVGGELRLLASELEKLCLYVGDRPEVTLGDVQALGVSRVREEDFWELGNAVTARDLAGALWFLSDAFSHGRHPIPLVASVAAALRKALQVFSAAEAAGVRGRPRQLPPSVLDAVAKARGGRKPHPFALLKEWERARRWGAPEALAQGLVACRDADRALKTSAGRPELVVERLIIQLCRG